MNDFEDFLNGDNGQQAPDASTPQSNPFADFLSGEDDAQKIRQTLTGVDASGITPDQAAEAKQLSKKTGLPQNVVEGTLPQVKQQTQRADLIEMAKSRPEVAKLLQDPNVAKVAHDDVGALSAIWDATTNALERGTLGVKQAIYQYGAESAAQTAQDKNASFGSILKDEMGNVATLPGPFQLAGAVDRYAVSRYDNMVGNDDTALAEARLNRVGQIAQQIQQLPFSKPATRARDAITEAGKEGIIPAIKAAIEDPAGTMALAAEMGVQSTPQLAAATAVTMVTKNPMAGAAALGLTGYAQERYSSPAEFLAEKGINLNDPKQADEVINNPDLMKQAAQYGYTRGMIIGAFSALSGGVAGKTLAEGPVKNMVAQMFAQAGIGGTQEATAELATTGKVSPVDVVMQTLGGFATAPAEVFGVGGELLSLQRRRAEIHAQHIQAEQAAESGQALNDIVQAASDSKLKQRSPEDFKAYMDSLGQKLGVNEVYIPADQLVQYFQDKGEDPFNTPGIDEQDLSSAVASGGDVKVPLSTYVTDIAPNHPDLAQHVRTAEDAWTPAEAEHWHQQIESVVDEEDKKLQQQLNEKAPLVESRQKVFEDMRDQLVKAGRTPDVAATEAQAQSALYATMGERLGVDPWKLYQDHYTTVKRSSYQPTEGQLLQTGADVAGANTTDLADVADARKQWAEKGTDSPYFKKWFGDSKVVDEQGKPLVVYHGTNANAYSHEHFQVFDTRPQSGRGGSFFSSSKDLAGQYGEKVYETYLSMKNPLIVHGDGNYWSGLSDKTNISGNVTPELVSRHEKLANELAAIFNELSALEGSDKKYHPKPKVTASEKTLDGKTLGSIPGVEGNGIETDKVVKEARALGYDGVIFKDVKDSPTFDKGYKVHNSDVYVAFSPEQIKSIHNQGTFDPNDARILYQGESVSDFQKRLESELGLKSLSLSKRGNSLYLDMIAVNKSEQGLGKGTAALKSITEYADANGMRISLTTGTKDDGFGTTSRNRLKSFYKRFGFVENKGRNKDFSVSGDMYREPNSLYQGDPTAPRGAFTPDTNTVHLFEAANLSTFIHESGHAWLEMMGKFAERAKQQIENGDTNPNLQGIIDDHQAILKYLGNGGEKLTTDQHETFARTIEQYFMEGKAPSAELQSAFQRFRSWLVSIYKNAVNLRVKMTPEIKNVIDRMLATDQEIKDTESANKFEAMDIEGATDAEKKVLAKLQRAATEEAESTLLEKALAPVRRQREKEYRNELKAMTDDVKTELGDQPEWRVVQYARGTEEQQPIKLDLAALEDRYGSDIRGDLPRGITSKKNGVDPQVMAEQLQFDSVDDMVNKLKAIGKTTLNKEAEAVAQQRMHQKYGDVMNDGTLAEEAMAAIHNEKRGDALAMEMKILRRIGADKLARTIGERRVKNDGAYDLQAYQSEAAVAENAMERLVAIESGRAAKFARGYDRSGKSQLNDAMKDINARGIREAARRVVGRMKQRDIGKVAQYQRAEVQAAEASRKAVAERDYERAAFYKYRQLLNHYLFMETKAAQDEVARKVKFMARLGDKKTVSTIDQGYLEQIHSLLEKYDLHKASLKEVAGRKSFAQWVQEQTDAGHDIVAPQELIDKAGLTHYSDATVEELRGLYDSVRQIESLGRMKQKYIDGKEERDYNELVGSFQDELDKLKDRVPDIITRNPGKVDLIKSALRSADASLLKIEQLCLMLDDGNPNGLFSSIVFKRIADAEAHENDMKKVFSKKLEDIIQPLDKKRMAESITIPGFTNRDGRVVSWTRKELMAVALNMGNEGNLSRLTSNKGENWTPDQLRQLTSHLNKQEWTAVQKIWDTIEELWPDIAELEKRVNRVAPEKVQPRAFKINVDGETLDMRGGYFPLKYDPLKDPVVAKRAEKSDALFQNNYVRATTRDGHTKGRTEQYARPLWLDLNIVPNHINQVIHDIAFREALMDVDRLTSDPRIKSKIGETFGREYADQFRPWLQTIANGMADGAQDKSMRFWTNMMRKFRTNASIVAMGFRWTTGISQLAGYSATAEMLGSKHLAVGLKEFFKNPVEMNKFVMEKSGEMRHRANHLDRDLHRHYEKMKGGADFNVIQNAAMSGIAVMDKTVAMPTWLGGYYKGLKEGMTDAQAVEYGDKVVRLTQGSGGMKDLAAVQRHSELFNLFTMFYSYFSAMYSRQRDVARSARSARSAADVGNVVMRSFYLMAMPAIVSDVLAGRGPSKDESWAEWMASEVAVYPFMSIPLLRDVISSINSGYGYSITPLSQIGSTAVNFVRHGIKAVEGKQVNPKSVAKEGLNLAGYALGLPTGQLGNTGEYLWDVMDGTESPENILDFMHGVALGPDKKK